jgi:hypothetical protein
MDHGWLNSSAWRSLLKSVLVAVRTTNPGWATLGNAGASDTQVLSFLDRQRDNGGLLPAVCGALVSPLVAFRSRQYRSRRHFFPRPGGHRRNHHAKLWVLQRRTRHRSGVTLHLCPRLSYSLLFQQIQYRSRSINPWRRLWLYRLNDHFTNLCQLYFHLLCARRRDYGWDEFKTLRTELSVADATWSIKQQPGRLTDKIFEIETHAEQLTVTPFTGPDRRSVFVPDRLALEMLDGGIVETRDDPEASFAGQTLETPWDQDGGVSGNNRDRS